MPATFHVVEQNGEVKGFKGLGHRPDGLKDGTAPAGGACLLPPMLLLRRFTDFSRPNEDVPLHHAYLALGALRAMLRDCEDYNLALSEESRGQGLAALRKAQIAEMFSGLGLNPGGKEIDVSGLREMISVLEGARADRLAHARSQLEAGTVDFLGLAELYKPGTSVVGPVGGAGEECGFLVRSCRYHEHKTLFGKQLSFHLELQFVASVGDCFAIISCQDEVGLFQGTRAVSSLAFRPLGEEGRDVDLRARLEERGRKYVEAAIGCKVYGYLPGCFLATSARAKRVGTASRGGRAMVDVETALDAGASVAPGSDNASLALAGVAGRYLKAKRQGRFSKEGSQQDRSLQRDAATGMLLCDGMCFFQTLPLELVWCCWPTLLGFSFTAKAFGHIVVNGLQPAAWDKHAWDGLVLPEDRKDLLQAVVMNQRDVGAVDIITGKGEGSTFLLYGPPGTGKTLTAEAMAELLERPLYILSAGELGTTPEVTEQKLSEALELCSRWDAIALIDEADILLEERTAGHLTRNAMLCVMLRILEYHSGVLFLTTNKASGVDVAVQSRLTLALKYDALNEATRKEVWTNLLRVAGSDPSCFDISELGVVPINGRQIKNCIRLALALARQRRVELTQDLLQTTLSIVSSAQNDLSTAPMPVGASLHAVRAMNGGQ